MEQTRVYWAVTPNCEQHLWIICVEIVVEEGGIDAVLFVLLVADHLGVDGAVLIDVCFPAISWVHVRLLVWDVWWCWGSSYLFNSDAHLSFRWWQRGLWGVGWW